ncbi:MAG: serine hydrolase [Syntrophobacteraceae bacterium]
MEIRRGSFICAAALLFVLMLTWVAEARPFQVNAKSAILIDMTDGRVLYEQNADTLIPPASITKVITLYLVFDAIREGRVHLWDSVKVSHAAASTGGSRMGLRAGRDVQLQELIRGAAVVSGNDACVALAEHLSGSVDAFVRKMNAKARELGMTRTVFMTPNGLPACGQVTTARDISKLSTAYLRRFPESLAIHSMQSYTYINSTHHNANRLLGKCPGVDGLKTGFVCAAGYNITATAKRGETRLLAVVLGAPSAGVRTAQTTKLLEAGFHRVNSGSLEYVVADGGGTDVPARHSRSARHAKVKVAKTVKHGRVLHAAKTRKGADYCKGGGRPGSVVVVKKTKGGKMVIASKGDGSAKMKSVLGKAKAGEKASAKQLAKKNPEPKKNIAVKKGEPGKSKTVQATGTSSKVQQAKDASANQKKQPASKKNNRQAQDSKKRPS